jgi:hypothetical protein
MKGYTYVGSITVHGELIVADRCYVLTEAHVLRSLSRETRRLARADANTVRGVDSSMVALKDAIHPSLARGVRVRDASTIASARPCQS